MNKGNKFMIFIRQTKSWAASVVLPANHLVKN